MVLILQRRNERRNNGWALRTDFAQHMGRMLADRICTPLDSANPVAYRPAFVETLAADAFPQREADLGNHAEKDNTNNHHDDHQHAHQTFDHEELRSFVLCHLSFVPCTLSW